MMMKHHSPPSHPSCKKRPLWLRTTNFSTHLFPLLLLLLLLVTPQCVHAEDEPQMEQGGGDQQAAEAAASEVPPATEPPTAAPPPDEDVTSPPGGFATGRLSQFKGFYTPRPLPPNAQFTFESVWAAWSAWSFCSKGEQMRVRACNTVKGFSCLGANLERRPCYASRMPGTPSRGRPAGSNGFRPAVNDRDYDGVDPWIEDRNEALRQLYPDSIPDSMPAATPRRLGGDFVGRRHAHALSGGRIAFLPPLMASGYGSGYRASGQRLESELVGPPHSLPLPISVDGSRRADVGPPSVTPEEFFGPEVKSAVKVEAKEKSGLNNASRDTAPLPPPSEINISVTPAEPPLSSATTSNLQTTTPTTPLSSTSTSSTTTSVIPTQTITPTPTTTTTAPSVTPTPTSTIANASSTTTVISLASTEAATTSTTTAPRTTLAETITTVTSTTPTTTRTSPATTSTSTQTTATSSPTASLSVGPTERSTGEISKLTPESNPPSTTSPTSPTFTARQGTHSGEMNKQRTQESEERVNVGGERVGERTRLAPLKFFELRPYPRHIQVDADTVPLGTDTVKAMKWMLANMSLVAETLEGQQKVQLLDGGGDSLSQMLHSGESPLSETDEKALQESLRNNALPKNAGVRQESPIGELHSLGPLKALRRFHHKQASGKTSPIHIIQPTTPPSRPASERPKRIEIKLDPEILEVSNDETPVDDEDEAKIQNDLTELRQTMRQMENELKALQDLEEETRSVAVTGVALPRTTAALPTTSTTSQSPHLPSSTSSSSSFTIANDPLNPMERARAKAMNLDLVPRDREAAGSLTSRSTTVPNVSMLKSSGEILSVNTIRISSEPKEATWSNWGEWGECFCDRQVRTRACNYDPNQPSKGCTGRSFESHPCASKKPCPKAGRKRPLPHPLHATPAPPSKSRHSFYTLAPPRGLQRSRAMFVPSPLAVAKSQP